MRKLFGTVMIMLASGLATSAPAADAPGWAYGFPPQGSPTPAAAAPADWYPGDHHAMPNIVAHGEKPDVFACSLWHYPNGKGRPENGGIA